MRYEVTLTANGDTWREYMDATGTAQIWATYSGKEGLRIVAIKPLAELES